MSVSSVLPNLASYGNAVKRNGFGVNNGAKVKLFTIQTEIGKE